eukprot:jgi/Galph1/3401/GphlegSOOS_G2065.1
MVHASEVIKINSSFVYSVVNSLDTCLVFTSTESSFDLHIHREFQVGNNTKLEILGFGEWTCEENLCLSKRQSLPPRYTKLGHLTNERNQLCDFKLHLERVRETCWGRIGIVHSIPLQQNSLKFGVGADSKGRRMAAFRDNNLTVSTDMEGSWAMKIHFHRKLDEKWI